MITFFIEREESIDLQRKQLYVLPVIFSKFNMILFVVRLVEFLKVLQENQFSLLKIMFRTK